MTTPTDHSAISYRDFADAYQTALGEPLTLTNAVDLHARGWTPEDFDILTLWSSHAFAIGSPLARDLTPDPYSIYEFIGALQIVARRIWGLLTDLEDTFGKHLACEWAAIHICAPDDLIAPLAAESLITGEIAESLQSATALLGHRAPLAWASGIPLDRVADLPDDDQTHALLWDIAELRGFIFLTLD